MHLYLCVCGRRNLDYSHRCEQRNERGRKRNGTNNIKKEKNQNDLFEKKTTNEKRQVVDKYAVNNDLK